MRQILVRDLSLFFGMSLRFGMIVVVFLLSLDASGLLKVAGFAVAVLMLLVVPLRVEDIIKSLK